jgi:C4-dicarboxylate-specific signal transduction histidine kinase
MSDRDEVLEPVSSAKVAEARRVLQEAEVAEMVYHKKPQGMLTHAIAPAAFIGLLITEWARRRSNEDEEADEETKTTRRRVLVGVEVLFGAFVLFGIYSSYQIIENAKTLTKDRVLNSEADLRIAREKERAAVKSLNQASRKLEKKQEKLLRAQQLREESDFSGSERGSSRGRR